MINLSDLENKANGATPGEWSVYDNSFDAGIVTGLRKSNPGEYTALDCGLKYDQWICGGEPSEGRFDGSNAAFVASANPQTVLTLISCLRDAVSALKGISHGDIINPHDRAQAALNKINERVKI